MPEQLREMFRYLFGRCFLNLSERFSERQRHHIVGCGLGGEPLRDCWRARNLGARIISRQRFRNTAQTGCYSRIHLRGILTAAKLFTKELKDCRVIKISIEYTPGLNEW